MIDFKIKKGKYGFFEQFSYIAATWKTKRGVFGDVGIFANEYDPEIQAIIEKKLIKKAEKSSRRLNGKQSFLWWMYRRRLAQIDALEHEINSIKLKWSYKFFVCIENLIERIRGIGIDHDNNSC